MRPLCQADLNSGYLGDTAPIAGSAVSRLVLHRIRVSLKEKEWLCVCVSQWINNILCSSWYQLTDNSYIVFLKQTHSGCEDCC